MNHDAPAAFPEQLATRLRRSLEAHSDFWCHAALRQCVPRLARYVADHPGQPVETSSDAIRHILQESCQPIGDGDRAILSPDGFERLVALVMRKLAQLRRIANRAGAIPNESSQWFG